MTLVEMMISLTVFAVIMGVVFTFLANSRRTYSSTSERVEYQQSIRAVLSLLTKEIRSAGCDPSGNGFDHFSVAGDTQLSLAMDLDGNGDTLGNSPDESVVYQYDAAQEELNRDGGAGAQAILRNVSGILFAYFDVDGNPLLVTPLSPGDRAAIRYVDIDITGESDTGEIVNYSTRILIRNG